ncbi:hypothetical protein [Polynucleobacter necessarius]|uniref:hypothetical protein n=1 Tax=Polynucleobacter necessarius TaxID=576610 RepID=UPI0013B06CDB|nr:hypothetical protein [Polynucleobacter necessarius]
MKSQRFIWLVTLSMAGELKIIHWPHIKGKPIKSAQITHQPPIESLIKEAAL